MTDDPRRITISEPLREILDAQRRWLLENQHPGLASALVFLPDTAANGFPTPPRLSHPPTPHPPAQIPRRILRLPVLGPLRGPCGMKRLTIATAKPSAPAADPPIANCGP